MGSLRKLDVLYNSNEKDDPQVQEIANDLLIIMKNDPYYQNKNEGFTKVDTKTEEV